MREKTFKEMIIEDWESKKDALTKWWNAVNPRNEYRDISKWVLFFTHTDFFKLAFPFTYLKWQIKHLFVSDRRFPGLRKATLYELMSSATFEIFMFLVLGAIIAFCYWAWHKIFGEPPVEALAE